MTSENVIMVNSCQTSGFIWYLIRIIAHHALRLTPTNAGRVSGWHILRDQGTSVLGGVRFCSICYWRFYTVWSKNITSHCDKITIICDCFVPCMNVLTLCEPNRVVKWEIVWLLIAVLCYISIAKFEIVQMIYSTNVILCRPKSQKLPAGFRSGCFSE